MNSHAISVLEFDKVVRMVVDRTSFGPGAERASRLSPSADVHAITEDQTRATELRSILDRGDRLPLEGAKDVRAALARAACEGAALSASELVDLSRTLAVVGRVSAFLSRRREACPRLSRLGQGLTPHEDLVEAVERTIDAETLEVRDGASAELSKIRRSIERTRLRLDEKLDAIIRKELATGTIQEGAVHIRNGRRVLPVKREARAKLRGIVHDRSASGATLFVEPLGTVALNNELAELLSWEEKEVERILREVSAQVGAHAEDIDRSVAILGDLDYCHASADLSRDLDCVAPVLNREGRLSIRNGRHPVLADPARRTGGAVVPLTLELGGDASTLVISGPNAGGKTVALKCVGLLVLMAQSGLHVPASPDTELAVFDDVFADIGDEQSIEQNLSTFSSHLRVQNEILKEARGDTLVLMDEMGAGTDPDEGASLAIAILEELTDRGVPTIATTHLGSVKNHVHGYPGMVNGSMAFNPETLEPAFRFVPGVPGASHALAIAESLGLPAPLVERARELRDADASKVDDLLADLTRREETLRTTLEEVRKEEHAARLLVTDYEERLKGVRDERKKIRGEALAEAREIVERAQSLVEETVKELRAKEAARETIRRARERVMERRAEVAREIEAHEREEVPHEGEPIRALVVGMAVALARMRRVGVLLTLPDGRGKVRVRVKNATVEVDAADLRAVEEGAVPRGREAAASVTSGPDDVAKNEVDLRGMTTDEAADAIEAFVSSAVVAGLSKIWIIHGKGTGALREKTHEVLKGIPAVKSFRLGAYGEGDTGVTVAELVE